MFYRRYLNALVFLNISDSKCIFVNSYLFVGEKSFLEAGNQVRSLAANNFGAKKYIWG